MPDKLTDSEIVKALECCILSDCSRNCPLYYTTLSYRQCREATRKNALDLINRLQAENERLKKLNEMFTDIGKMYSEIKAEAYKNFVERLKKEKFKINYCGSAYNVVDEDDIDNLLKEMVGENK